MSDKPNTGWNLLSAKGSLEPAWGTAYMVQQLTIAVVNLCEELRKIRRDMPINDAAKILREEQAAAAKLQDEEDERAGRAWMHTAGIGAWPIRRQMSQAARDGLDVWSEAGARTIVEAYPFTERQQAAVLRWWKRRYPNAATPVTHTRQKPVAKAEGGAA